MIDLINWIKNHRVKSFLLLLALFLVPIIIVQILFQIDTDIPFLQAKWSAADALAYVIGFATIVSTFFLSLIALYQSERAEKNTYFLNQIMAQKLYPVMGAQNFRCLKTRTVDGRPIYFPERERLVKRISYNIERPETDYIDLIVNVDISKDNLASCHMKEVDFDLYNNSEAVIRHLELQAIRICGYNNAFLPITIVNTIENDGISRLFTEKECIHIRLRFYFFNSEIQKAWEDVLGGVAFILFVVNTTITGQKFNEYIAIRVSNDGHVNISYGDRTLREVEESN